ncbi:MAG: hypothetical protein ABIJ75_02525 [Actinomycetota bacterium]
MSVATQAAEQAAARTVKATPAPTPPPAEPVFQSVAIGGGDWTLTPTKGGNIKAQYRQADPYLLVHVYLTPEQAKAMGSLDVTISDGS